MFNPPFAAPPDYVSALHPLDEREECWFIFSGARLLVSSDQQRIPNAANIALKRSLYMGTFDGRHLFAGEVDHQEQASPGWLWCHLRILYGGISEAYYVLAGRAMQLLDWDRTHRHCGCCGELTFIRITERCRECLSCGHLTYPKLAPAIAVLIQKEEQILLARGPHS